MIGSPEVVELLISRGAKIEAEMPGVGTPLIQAARFGRTDFAKILLSYGANIEARSTPEAPPKLSAFKDPIKDLPKSMQDEIAKQMPQMDMDPESIQRNNRKAIEEMGGEAGYVESGKTALISAAGALPANLEMVTLLLTLGAKIDAVDPIGRTALHEAAWAGAADVISLLVKKGAKVDARTRNGVTPLHLAVRPTPSGFTNIESVKFLLEHGADFKAKTRDGLTPLEMRRRVIKAFIPRLRVQSGTPANETEKYIQAMNDQSAQVEALLKQHERTKKGDGMNTGVWAPVFASAVLIFGLAIARLRGRAPLPKLNSLERRSFRRGRREFRLKRQRRESSHMSRNPRKAFPNHGPA
jgi:ankyrin